MPDWVRKDCHFCGAPVQTARMKTGRRDRRDAYPVNLDGSQHRCQGLQKPTGRTPIIERDQDGLPTRLLL